MTAVQNKADSPIAHLSDDDIENLGRELDAIRQHVLDTRGEDDARYIRTVIKTQRTLEAGSRAVLLFSLFPPAWWAGTAGLSVAKILENMEIGHNVMHGQWDWMRDSKIHSTTWEWDHASPAEQWKHAHNSEHHTYTNVLGKDGDLGYGKRQSVLPDRASSVPGSTQQPIRRDRRRAQGGLRSLRAHLHDGSAGEAGCVGLAQGDSAVATQRHRSVRDAAGDD